MWLLCIMIWLFAVTLIDYTNTATLEEENAFFKAYGNGDGSKQGWKYIYGCGHEEFCKRYRGRSLTWLKSALSATTKSVYIKRQFKQSLEIDDVSEITATVIACKMLKCDGAKEVVVVVPLGTNRYCNLKRATPIQSNSDDLKYWLEKCYDMATGFKGHLVSLKNWLFKCKNV